MPDTRIRSRDAGLFTHYGTSCTQWWWNQPWDCNTMTPVRYGTFREVSSDTLNGWPLKGPTTEDVGGPFHLVRSRLRADWDFKREYRLGSDASGRKFTGTIIPALTPFDWHLVDPEYPVDQLFSLTSDLSDQALIAQGSKAISATIPTNSTADASVTVAELYREGLPSLIGASLLRDRANFFRSLGSEYLNYEFGWKPLISDLRNVSEAISQSEKLLAQLARDSGRNVRRRLAFPEERTTDIQYSALRPDTNASVYLLDAAPGGSVTTKTYSKSWFSGCYTYHYDPADLSEASRIATQARLLLGLKIDPEVLWNLAPWSWLVDWFVNIGPVLHNLSAFGQDGLVLRYGYLMHEHRKTKSHIYRTYLRDSGDFPAGDRSATLTMVSKRRIRATPYGFGLTVSSFTARQWAILTALGITRL